MAIKKRTIVSSDGGTSGKEGNPKRVLKRTVISKSGFRRVYHVPEEEEKSPYVDNIEEYIFSLPRTPIKYTDLVVKWVLPYQQNSFSLFGVELKITPRWKHTYPDNVQITGLLLECGKRGNHHRTMITGPVGTWYAKAKTFAKVNAVENDD